MLFTLKKVIGNMLLPLPLMLLIVDYWRWPGAAVV